MEWQQSSFKQFVMEQFVVCEIRVAEPDTGNLQAAHTPWTPHDDERLMNIPWTHNERAMNVMNVSWNEEEKSVQS